MSRVDVSVVIPTYNRRTCLGRALQSVAAQTVAPREVLVIDDGSTDGTKEAAAAEMPEATVVRQPNRGVSAARNRGIRIARGRWVAFLDSDDEWLPPKLERQLAGLAQAPEHRLCHTDEIWMRRGRRVNPRRRHRKRGGRIFPHCLPLCVISPSSVLVERRLLEEVGLFDEELPACEDYDLWLRICAREPVLLVAEPLLVKHGGHADQLSRRPGLDRYRIRALEKIVSAPELGAEDRRRALETMIEKIDVYVGGATKRGKRQEVEELRALRRDVSGRLGGSVADRGAGVGG